MYVSCLVFSSSLSEHLAKQVECPICMETYKDPKALPCLHTYCKLCVQQLVHRRIIDQTVLCPQCRASVHVEGNNVDNLPTVFFINGLIDFHLVLKKACNSDIACQNCCEGKAVTFCQTCPPNGMFVCTDCVTAHKKMKVFEGHKVIPISALKHGSLLHLPARKISNFSCTTHEGEMKKLYCYQCKVLICRDCTLVDHSGHKYDFVKSVAAAFKDEIQTRLGPLQELLQNVLSAAERMQIVMIEISKQKEEFTRAINNSCDSLIAVIEEQRGALLEQSNTAFEGKLCVLESQSSDLQLAQATVDSLLGFVEKSTENACDEEFISLKKPISDRLQEIGEKFKIIELNPKEVADLSFALSPSTQQLKNLCWKSCLVKASIQLSAKDTVNQIAKSIIVLKDVQAQLCPVEMNVEASVKSLVDGSITACNVAQKAPSRYEVSYTPQIRGHHQLSVFVNNTVVRTEQLFVHHPPTLLGQPVRQIKGVKEPFGISLDSERNLYVAEGYSLSKFNAKGQRVLTIDGKGEESFANVRTYCPHGVTVGKDGCIYLSADYKVFKYNKDGGLVKSIGSGKAGGNPGEFDVARCVRVYNNRLYVCEIMNKRIQVFDCNLNFVTMFGTEGDHKLQSPVDLDFDSQGNVYVTDFYEDQIAVFDCNHQFKQSFSSKGEGSGRLGAPWGICVVGEYVYVTEHHNHCVSLFLLSGQFVCSFGGEGRKSGQLLYPHGVVVDSDGFCFVSDEDNDRIQVF